MIKEYEKIKLLIISASGLFLGGAEKSLYLFLKYTSLNKDHISVIVPFYSVNGFFDKVKELGIKTDIIYRDKDDVPLSLYIKNPIGLFKRIISRILYFFKILIYIVRTKPEVLYLNGIRCGTAAIAGFILNKKIIWHLRGFEDIFSSVIKRTRLWLIKFLANKIIVLSNYEKNRIIDFFNDNNLKNKIVVIPNGIELDRGFPNVQRNEVLVDINLDNKIIIGCVGHVAPWKGVDIFIKIALVFANRREDIVFLHLGPVHECFKDYYEKMLNYSKSILNKYLFFLGYKENILGYMNLFDIFFFPTRSEGFPRVVLEAMFSGKPVLTTPIAGNLDMIDNNITGILVDVDDENKIVSELERLVKNRELRNYLGKNARKKVIENYDIKSVAKRIDEEIRNIKQ